MEIRKVREAYITGELDKHQYMKFMYKFHNILEQYVGILQDNQCIESIVVCQDGVVFNMGLGSDIISMIHPKQDMYSTPLQCMNFGAYEKEEFTLMCKLIKPNDVVLDIGANDGYYSIRLKKKYKDITLYSFEPIPKNYEVLLKNFELNGISAEKVHNIGLLNINQEVDFFYDKECSMASSLTNLRGRTDTNRVRCQVKTLDSFVEEEKVGKIDFIKCDVEGSELFVYEGGIDAIGKYKPIVFSEMLRKWAAKFSYHPNDIISLFERIGYSCFGLEEGKLNRVMTVDDSTIATNYIFLHREKHQHEINGLGL